MLHTHRLLILQQVARHGSLAGAARALRYTQPAVAHHVTQLEREVGTPLIVRHGRGVRLTEAGQALAAHADAVVSRLAVAEEEVAAIAGLRAGRVRLAAFPTAAATIVPRAIAALRQAHPDVAVSLYEAEPPEALADLRSGEVDIAVTFRYGETPEENGTDLVARALFDDPIDLITPSIPSTPATPTSTSAGPTEPTNLADLDQSTWVAGCERCRLHLVGSCREAGFEPDIAFTTDDFVTQQSLVAAGLAVAAIPRSTLGAHANPDVRAWQLPELGTRTVEAVVLAGNPPPAVAALHHHLLEISSPG